MLTFMVQFLSIQLREFWKELEYILHHRFSKFDRPVFLTFKWISYFLEFIWLAFEKKAIPSLAGNLNSGRSYLITAVIKIVNVVQTLRFFYFFATKSLTKDQGASSKSVVFYIKGAHHICLSRPSFKN